MIAGLFVVTGKDYVALCKQLAKEATNSSEGTIAGLAENDYLAEANRMQQAVDQMSEAVKQHGWDGEWFLRAYDFFGNNNPWVIIGETVAGRGNDAWNHYTKILPSYVEENIRHYTRWNHT